MAVLLFYSEIDPVEQWLPALNAGLPDLEVRIWPEIGDEAEIDYALVWKPPHGLLASLPKLKLIHSIGAGVDPLFEDPSLPTDVPIVRMVDDCLRNMMSEYAVYAVLHYHRDMGVYQAQQAEADWTRHWPVMTPDAPVGILGLGEIGHDMAVKFAALDFPTHGWSRGAKEIAGVTCHHGAQGLVDMLALCRYVACVLPLTAETTAIADAAFFRKMQAGSYFINIGRGAHVIEADLIAALDSGHLAGAFLDVFNTEPLPPDDPLWRHPKVIVTPHIAAETDPADGAREVVKNLQRFETGVAIPTLVQRDKGY